MTDPVTAVVQKALDAAEADKKRVREGTAYPLEFGEPVRFPIEPAAGDYLVVFRKAGYAETRYPLRLARGVPHEATVELAAAEDVPEGFVYVPKANYATAYDPEVVDDTGENRRPQQVTVEGFYMARFNVTCAQYLEFLNDREEDSVSDARKRSPRTAAESGYHWPEPGGDRITTSWPLDWPVPGISRKDADAYAKWYTLRLASLAQGKLPDGSPRWKFDLPSEAEWELAAGGVLGWMHSWGDRFDAGFCRMLESRGSYNQPEPYGLFPADESATFFSGVEVQELLDLRAHPGKRAIHRTADGFPFLGFRIFPDHRRVLTPAKVRACRKMRRLQHEAACGRLSRDSRRSSIASWIGHWKWADSYYLRKTTLRLGPAGLAQGRLSSA